MDSSEENSNTKKGKKVTSFDDYAIKKDPKLASKAKSVADQIKKGNQRL